jgi:hypothetical protein
MQKRTHYLLSIAVGIFVLPAVMFYFSACHKNKDCKATITVTNATNGLPVVGASVMIAPPPPTGTLSSSAANFGSQQTQTGTTDGSGSITFTFKLPAILQATIVTLPVPYVSCVNCPALVQLQESSTVTKSVTVQ